MERTPLIFMFLLLCLFSHPGLLPAAPDPAPDNPAPTSKQETKANETIFKWEGRLGFIELKADGDLYTPFGVFTRGFGSLYPKWHSREGFIILKDHHLQTPFGLYRPYYN